ARLKQLNLSLRPFCERMQLLRIRAQVTHDESLIAHFQVREPMHALLKAVQRGGLRLLAAAQCRASAARDDERGAVPGKLQMLQIVDVAAKIEMRGVFPEQGVPLRDQRSAVAC